MASAVPPGVPDRRGRRVARQPRRRRRCGQPVPEGAGGELLAAARDAFTHGFHLTAAVSAAVVGATAVLVVALLRTVRTGR
jgi:MFS transporter, DHA2 family, multidrug resistance protein